MKVVFLHGTEQGKQKKTVMHMRLYKEKDECCFAEQVSEKCGE